MITADQLVAHAIGDYVLQSDWMASKKRTENLAAAVHAFCYSIPFLLLVPSPLAWAVIVVTHAWIDRYGLARYVVWAKNFLAPKWVVARKGFRTEHTIVSEPVWGRNLPWSECTATGYPPDRPPFLAVWLLIVCDNCIHVLINGAALKWL